jgi:D-erythrulose 1-phosphate 3-epimerase
MPPRCEDVYLAFEFYCGTKEIGYQALYRIDESIKYWRRFIPKDGMLLSEILDSVGTTASHGRVHGYDRAEG